MRTSVYILVLALFPIFSFSQSCEQKLEDARRAYFNGNISQVAGLLEGCLDKELEKEDRFDAYKLLVDAKLLLNEDSEAEVYMEKLLTLDPTYEPREVDIAEFKSLYDTYDIRTNYNFGISFGVIRPDYVMLYPQSISGQSVQPIDYDEIPGYTVGLKGGLEIFKNTYADASFLFSKTSFKMQEDIMNFRRVASFERELTLSIPLQLKYVIQTKRVRPYFAVGYSIHYMLHANGDINHWPLDTGLEAFFGFPYSVTDYDLTSLRKKFAHAWMVSGGLQFPFGTYQLELNLSYERGFSNLTNEKERYTNEELIETYAYVSDDYKLNSYIVSVSFLKNIAKPIRK